MGKYGRLWGVPLSVSSVGSWALQRGGTAPPQDLTTIFQYPQSDRGRCNCRATPPRAQARLTFSILSRIVGAATYYCDECWGFYERDFQYPQSDRGRCNAGCGDAGGRCSCPFSILSRIVGAATVLPGLPPQHPAHPFSILSRIVGAATIPAQLRAGPSIGSFSILSRIVGAATSSSPQGQRCWNMLSVSSVGSWALQPVQKPSAILPPPPLSVSSLGSWALQPRSTIATCTRTVSFSILSRIVGAATGRGPWRRHPGWRFQYPQSDRGRCNNATIRFGMAPTSLSVSSVGSWALQPGTPHAGRGGSGKLSVSSVGSWALQQCVHPAGIR